MRTKAEPNRPFGNVDNPNAPSLRVGAQRADTVEIEQQQTGPGLARTWCSVAYAYGITPSVQPSASSTRCKACAPAYSDGPAFDLPQDLPLITPETRNAT